MRNTILAVLAFGSILAADSSPAAAHDYPYCMQSRPEGRLCNFVSYAQCMATASGLGAECIVNPYFAFAEPVQQYPRPRRAHRSGTY